MRKSTCSLLVCCCGFLLVTSAFAANHVAVESKTVPPGASGVTVGVYIENDIRLYALTLPLELRSVTPGSFTANAMTFAAQGRVAASGLMDHASVVEYGVAEASNTCSGPVSNTYLVPSLLDFVSPDAIYFSGILTGDDVLREGSDGEPGVGIPSFLFTFDVNGVLGMFEIDTCCISPGRHLTYFDAVTIQETPAEFTKGIITIEHSPSDPATNQVTVECKTVGKGEKDVKVGVYIENDVPLAAITVPLEIRSITPGSFIVDHLTFGPQGRVAASGLTSFVNNVQMGTPEAVNSCSGPISSTYNIFSANSPDFVSPDAVFFAGIVIGNNWLPAGSDGQPGVGTPSFLFTFDVSETEGFFEIDTCCVYPANGLFLIEFPTYIVAPTDFRRGIISIGDAGDPPPRIVCPDDITVGTFADLPECNPELASASGACGSNAQVQCERQGISGAGCTDDPVLVQYIFTATDESGKTGTCVWTVTVTAPDCPLPAYVTGTGERVSCSCDCNGDPLCDGVTNVLDVCCPGG